MKGCKVLFSKGNDNWATPKWLYNEFIDKGFFDPCPLNSDFDGLKIEWKDKNFVNPPYSQISKWVDKGIEEFKKGKIIIFLIPARTDTKYFHRLLIYNPTIYFIKGRLKFNDDPKGSATFPSVLIKLDKDIMLGMWLTKEKII